jgi:hypothetical protein
MPSPMTRWSPLRRRRRLRGSLRRARHASLDIARRAPHDMSDAEQAQARARIEALIERLQPQAIDAGSREVLNNLINAWMDQASARVNRHHLEQTAVSAMLIGLAREEVTRRRPRYEADYARAQHAFRTLAVTYQQLTGRTDLGASPGPGAAGPAGGLDPEDGRHWPLVLTDVPAVPMPRDGLAAPARHGSHHAAQAGPGDGGTGRI